MALTIAQAFMDGVRQTLLDPNKVYWSDAELVGYYNIFVTVAIGENPTALTKTVSMTPAAGVDQTLPADAVVFIRVPSNVNGPGITQVTPEAMTDADPYWYTQPKTLYVQHVIPDERDPLKFRVYPPNNGSGSINVTYAYAPNDASSPSDSFTLTEAFRNPARNAVLGMALSKNIDRGDLQKASYFFSQLDQGIASQLQAQMRVQAQVIPGSPLKTSE